jgi:hypothetical protein
MAGRQDAAGRRRPGGSRRLSIRTVVLHDRALAEQAIGLGVPLRFLTPPDGIFYAGESFYRHLLAQLGRRPAAGDILDCADDAAAAVEALANGWRALVLRAPAQAAVADIARRHGARLLARRPAAIDPLARADWATALRVHR